MSAIPFLDFAAPIVEKVLSYIPDPAQKLKAQQELMASLQSWDGQQVSIDVEEARSNSIFVAGWRPFIGWTCGVAFAYKFVAQPLLIFGLVASGSGIDWHTLPTLDAAEMTPVLFGMLGLGGMRTFEKIKMQ
jgi:hypothetical protein